MRSGTRTGPSGRASARSGAVPGPAAMPNLIGGTYEVRHNSANGLNAMDVTPAIGDDVEICAPSVRSMMQMHHFSRILPGQTRFPCLLRSERGWGSGGGMHGCGKGGPGAPARRVWAPGHRGVDRGPGQADPCRRAGPQEGLVAGSSAPAQAAPMALTRRSRARLTRLFTVPV